MFWFLASDVSQSAVHFSFLKEWGPAGMLIFTFGAFSVYILPKLITVSSNFKQASEGLQNISKRAEDVVNRAETLYPPPKPKTWVQENGREHVPH